MLFCRPCFPVTADDVTYDGACQCQGGETCCGTSVLPNSQMPKLKLIYFDMPGRAAKIRLALQLAQIPFEDQRIPQSDWSKLKPVVPMNRLPVLEIGDQNKTTLAESLAIFRYVGMLGGLSLHTSTPLESALEIAVLHACEDIEIKLWEWVVSPADKQAKLAETLWKDVFPNSLSQLDAFLKPYETYGFALGGCFSLADIAIYQLTQNMTAFPKDVNAYLKSHCPTLLKIQAVTQQKISEMGQN